MKKRIALAFVAITCIAFMWDNSRTAYSNAAGAPAGFTGAPGEQTCGTSGCHSSSPVTPVPGWITSNIPPGGYTPGVTYSITATATYNGRSKFGFQVSPRDANNALAGTMAITSGQMQLVGAGKYMTHTTSGNSSPNTKSWTFNWTAPAYGTGAVTFYGAFNCANGDATDNGDLIYTSTMSVQEMPTQGVDAGVHNIVFPSLLACSGSFSPIVKLQNYGTTTLTSATINYMVDANTPSTFAWTGSLNTSGSATITLPSVTVTSGAHTFKAYTTLPNGGNDTLPSNDTASSAFTATLTGASMPFVEGFESTTFPPAGWRRVNPDNATTWARTTSAKYSGVASAYMNNYNYSSGVGQNDELITPPVDLTTSTGPNLTFEVAYRLYTNPSSNPNYSDTLTVYISTDCGVTWTQLYKKFSTALATATPPYSTSQFVPTSAQWRMETISLTPYASCSTALFRFVNTSSYENQLYLDDINIASPQGVNELNDGLAFELFPNPANDAAALQFTLQNTAGVSVKIYDVNGRVVKQWNSAEMSAGAHNVPFDLKELGAGMYFVRVSAGDKTGVKKLSITR
ncbi:MAG TPA: choice-of-anchor V domain-containing protein [Bacteroidia bacterium]|jgi:hypothetical protein